MVEATQMPVPAGGGGAPPPLPALDWNAQISGFMAQPAVRRAFPALIGLGVIAAIAAVYLAIAQGPQRVLYSDISDGERAKVVETLEASGISYSIDSATGVISVAEDDVYRARMLVASEAGLAAPNDASAMLDAIPIGSSRTLEGERLRLARERDLMLTIREIDGIESVRVHLATPERSVFIREASAPSASVMVRLTSGRSLGQSQVEAIVNLISGSVPGLTSDAVRVVDHNGRLLSSAREEKLDSLLLQREFESKLREQLTTLLLPLLGDGNFTSQVQVELDHDEVTAARESYDKEGVVRSETERSASSTGSGAGTVGGIPGVTANTPPPDAQLVDEAPRETGAANLAASDNTGNSTSAIRRDYELGREVAVTSKRPGGLVKLSVAVAVSDEALKSAKPLTAEKLQTLVSAAVGANPDRGDQVQVVVSAFEVAEMAPLEFYEEAWFAMALRYLTALIAVLLVIFMVARPLLKRTALPASAANDDDANRRANAPARSGGSASSSPHGGSASYGDLPEQVDLARKLAASQPERAVEALQRMLEAPAAKAGS